MRMYFAAALLSAAPSALFAQAAALPPTEYPARVQAVTLFPWGAQVTRTVELDTAGGQVLVPNLPEGTDPAALRVSGTGVTIGAVTLIDGRVPASDAAPSAALKAARAAVAAAREALAAGEDGVARIRLAAEAARAGGTFLQGVSTVNTPVADLAALARTVSDGVQAAGEEALAAEARARQAQAALDPEREALARAEAALAALEHPARNHDALLIETGGAAPGATGEGKAQISITTFVAAAGWTPSYDLRLESGSGRLSFERFVSVHQASGEDWSGVALTLSTARPSERVAPSELWPELLRAGPPPEIMPVQADGVAGAVLRKMGGAEPMVASAAPVAESAQFQMTGETVVYSYPAAVDIRDGVENLRLRLDALSRPVSELAEAVPLFDETAYRMIEGRNEGQEALLPGPATLFLDGAVVGMTDLAPVAAGDRFRLGFGAIDGLRLKRIVPQSSEGDRGLITKSNERRERAEITVENLSGRDWPVRLIDRVPYAEQEALRISWTAKPEPAATDWQDKRGLLVWNFDLAAGAKQNVTLDTVLNWPAGEVLQ